MLSEEAQEILEKLWIDTIEGKKTSIAAKEAGKAKVIDELARLKFVVSSQNEIKLTRSGRDEAGRIIRRHRLAERLLHDVLDIEEEDMEESACQFEHILSEGVTQNICTLLGHPRECPHGRPIPPGECCHEGRKIASRVIFPLSEMARGTRGHITYLQTAQKNVMQKLLAMGVLPGQTVEIIQTSPSRVFQIGQTQVAVDREIADSIFVRSSRD